MRGLGARGQCARQSGDTQAGAANIRDQGEFPALAQAGIRRTMKRAAWLAIATILAATLPSAAQNYTSEELRIPMAAAGPRGLEALLIRPTGSGPYPLALISHGAPRDGTTRPGMS